MNDRAGMICFAFLTASIAGVVACVDSIGPSRPETGSDAGDASSDGIAADAMPGVDAGVCDPSKPFGATSPVGVNLPSGNTFAGETLTGDERTLFVSLRDGGGASAIQASSRVGTSDPFPTPTLTPNVNVQGAPNSGPFVSADGLNLYFYSIRGSGAFDIFFSSRPTRMADFAAANVVPNVNSTASDTSPFLSADGLTLYFASNRPPALSMADYDIYTATRNAPDGIFGTPMALSNVNNAGAYDTQPVVSADGLTLYFSSGRSPNQGMRDIWVSHRSSLTEAFSTPTGVTELNTAGLDAPVWLSADACKLYVENGGVLFSATKGR